PGTFPSSSNLSVLANVNGDLHERLLIRREVALPEPVLKFGKVAALARRGEVGRHRLHVPRIVGCGLRKGRVGTGREEFSRVGEGPLRRPRGVRAEYYVARLISPRERAEGVAVGERDAQF